MNNNIEDIQVKRSDKLEFKRNEFFLNPSNRKYDRQYFSMYQYRLNILKDRVIQQAMTKWGDGTKKIDGQTIIKQDKILDITSNQLCWVVGTVFCDYPFKLNILSDVEKGTDDILPITPSSYLEDFKDSIVMIEDESGRAILHGDESFLNKNLLVTGCIVAILGIEIQAGIFEIMDIAYPKSISQNQNQNQVNSSGKIALISGLNIGFEDDLRIELLKQYLIGELGNNDDKEFNSEIESLIIAGNSILPFENLEAENDLKNFITSNNYGSKNISKYNSDSLKKLDNLLTDLLINLKVMVMPGVNDPAEISLPQQPLHKSLFKNNLMFLDTNRLQRLTNPQWFEINNLKILGTSGQNIDDVKRYCSKISSLQIMKSNIYWQNFIPTAPDTLYCYPYENEDPFVFQELPNVYFVGNQEKYESEMLEYQNNKIRLISLPKFSETGEFVILDLETLNTEVIKIDL
ncbi:unnamed protein product [Candida verbasci]|uniref:DNA-directed DNA polymerase n=1 Tax=Candida verbasci TaxID=1227364 RepID=A0A9W4U0H8_9ASCO|nr:unnamed protein product [Candida verbasci]